MSVVIRAHYADFIHLTLTDGGTPTPGGGRRVQLTLAEARELAHDLLGIPNVDEPLDHTASACNHCGHVANARAFATNCPHCKSTKGATRITVEPSFGIHR